MRVLLLRPEPDARRVASLLASRGHHAVIAPIIAIERRIPVALPAKDYACTLVTSANALDFLPADLPARLKSIPLFLIGERSAAIAAGCGFTQLRTGASTAAELGSLAAHQIPAGSTALYLTGRPRKPLLEQALLEAGIAVDPLELYEALVLDELPPDGCRALAAGVDAVLHYSRASAQAASLLIRKAGLDHRAACVRHLCLSRDVAEGLAGNPDWPIEISAEPSGSALLDLLDKPV